MEEIVMNKVINIDEKNYCDYVNLNVVAFSLAYGGAMGSPGEILVVTKEALVYRMNYVYGNMTIEMCDEVCPQLKDCEFGMFDVDKTPIGWKGVRLGFGNFLVLSDPIYNTLKDEILDMSVDILYSRWLEMTLNLLRTDIS